MSQEQFTPLQMPRPQVDESQLPADIAPIADSPHANVISIRTAPSAQQAEHIPVRVVGEPLIGTQPEHIEADPVGAIARRDIPRGFEHSSGGKNRLKTHRAAGTTALGEIKGFLSKSPNNPSELGPIDKHKKPKYDHL